MDKRTLKDFINFVVDNRGKTPPLADKGIELIEVNAIKGDQKTVDYSQIRKYVSEDTYSSWFRTGHPKCGDVLITTVGAIGRVAYVRDPRGCIAQNIISLRPNPEVLHGNYLYYFLNYGHTQKRLQNLNIGVAQPSLKVPHLLDLEVSFPLLQTQKKIAAMLSTYDDLIENNKRRIKILEQMAQAIYREWFVNFRFRGHQMVKMVDSPLGKIPEGWEVKKATDAIAVNPVTKVPKQGVKPFVSMGSLSNHSMLINSLEFRSGNSGSKYRNGDTLFARITPCLENGKTAYVQFLPSDSDVAIGSTEFIVLRSKTLVPELVYLMARSNEFRGNAIKSMSGASGRQRVQEACFDKFLFAHPDPNILSKFAEQITPFFRYVHTISQKNNNLRQTRDLLLPKLISGELDVSELDIKTEGIAA